MYLYIYCIYTHICIYTYTVYIHIYTVYVSKHILYIYPYIHLMYLYIYCIILYIYTYKQLMYSYIYCIYTHIYSLSIYTYTVYISICIVCLHLMKTKTISIFSSINICRLKFRSTFARTEIKCALVNSRCTNIGGVCTFVRVFLKFENI